MMRYPSSVTEPLLEAIKMGHENIAMEKLRRGEYSDLEYQGESHDGTSLYWAAAKGLDDLVRFLLLLGACVDTTTEWGGTALHAAADNGQEKIVEILLENSADVDAKTSSGETPCHLAAYRGSLQATMLLVEGGANTRSRNDQGNDVMREAMQNRRYEVVKYLWSLIQSDYKTPKEEQRAVIPESTIIAETFHNFPFKTPQNYQRKPRSEDCNTFTRRSSVQEFSFKTTSQQQSYPPAARRCCGLPAAQNPVFLHQRAESSHTLGMDERRLGQPEPPMRYFSSSALQCRSGMSTPSEDEVDWDTSLCVDEDKFKTRLWGKEL